MVTAGTSDKKRIVSAPRATATAAAASSALMFQTPPARSIPMVERTGTRPVAMRSSSRPVLTFDTCPT